MAKRSHPNLQESPKEKKNYTWGIKEEDQRVI
jgi:hypothetical protein